MNNYSPKVGLVNTEEFLRYYEFALQQLNINYKVIDSIVDEFDFFISSKVTKIDKSSLVTEEQVSGFVVTVARSKQGQIVVYPVSSFQENEVINPAIDLSESNASNCNQKQLN